MNQQAYAKTCGAGETPDAIGIADDRMLVRLRFLEFGDKDAQVLSALHDKLSPYWAQFGERFYTHLSSFPSLQSYLQTHSLDRLKASQSAYFSSLSSGRYDNQYIRDRIAVGLMHQRAGLSPEWYLGTFRKYLADLMPALWQISGNDFAKFEETFNALSKIVFFDIVVVLDSYFTISNEANVVKKHYQEQLVYQTNHDGLTGLPNRMQLLAHLPHALEQANKSGQTVALLMLNIDEFKLINDSVSHLIGDQLLQAAAQRLRACISKGDFLSRHGGDEFALVLTQSSSVEDLAATCNRLSEIIAEPFVLQDYMLRVTCSIGAALYPTHGKDIATLLKCADIALFNAKKAGRNCSMVFSGDMHERIQERIKLESELRVAVVENQLRLHYQPIADLQNGKMIELEALVRWQHPELGLIPPLQFIPVAEESELIAMVGEWVLRQACHDMRTWHDDGFPNIHVAVNVSPKQFQDPFLADKVEEALAIADISPSLLALEITETVLMKNTALSEATLRRLKDLGVSLVLDDFGTGYSALSYLKHFPFDRVKIDRAFIQDIVTDPDNAALTRAIISMAHSLGIRVVAEGVEAEDQCEFLRRHMCDEVQGFFYSKPVQFSEVESMLKEKLTLPNHLLRLQKPTRTLLLVDDESNILMALKRLLRRDGYEILTANNGQEGLELLGTHAIDVIVSDQRMPGMTGVEFLRSAKIICPNTVRIVLSGYTELQSVTDAVNEGAIYKFLTKPWDDPLLREHIIEAFRHKEMADENQRLDLAVRTANQELAAANRQMEKVLREKQQIAHMEVNLDIVHQLLKYVSTPLLGLNEDGTVAFANNDAVELFAGPNNIIGSDIKQLLPEMFYASPDSGSEAGVWRVRRSNAWFKVTEHPIGMKSRTRGKLISLTKII